MDKSVKYYEVLMVRRNSEFFRKYKLPVGYTIKPYEEGMEEKWAELETEVGEFSNILDARKYFKNEFIKEDVDLSNYCYFVESPKGNVVATASLWFGKHFDEGIKYRLHWVGVSPDYRGKGLAKALISYILKNEKLKDEKYIYLTTQSWSYKAVNLYLRFGFKPYSGSRPENWECCHMDFENYNNEAWELIWSKIK